eukprot:6180242-Pleurochrysis_carterae.AAC.2
MERIATTARNCQRAVKTGSQVEATRVRGERRSRSGLLQAKLLAFTAGAVCNWLVTRLSPSCSLGHSCSRGCGLVFSRAPQ